MKLYIRSCWEYPLHELDIPDWLAKEKGFDSQFTGTIDIIKETEEAYVIAFQDETINDFQRDRYWLPQSQCKIVERTGPKKPE